MFSVELYGRVRHACHIEGLSQREAARRFGIHRNTVRKMLAFAVPPGYRRAQPPPRPKLGAFTAIIDQILAADRAAPPKQRHTAKRIFDRLRAEHGYAGSYTTVKAYVHEHRARAQEMFVSLAHPPGHAQADFGEAVAVIGGIRQKVHFFCLDLPHSDAGFLKAYPAERTEAFLDGHNAAFAFLGGVPQSILYDNTRLAVARILGDGTRQRTRAFAELQSHYLFLDRFGRPGKGNDKGKVEGLVGYARRNFLVPVPVVPSFAVLNAHLEQRCLERLDHRVRGHQESIGERLVRDLSALQPRPPTAYEACERKPARVSARSLVRYDRNDYSVPTAYGHRPVLVKGYVAEVVIACGAAIYRPAPALLWARGVHLRSAALSGAAGAEDRRSRSGGTTAGLGVARSIRDAARPAGGAHGQGRQAGIRSGSAAARELSARGRRGRRAPGAPAGDDRCHQASGAVPDRVPAAGAGAMAGTG